MAMKNVCHISWISSRGIVFGKRCILRPSFQKFLKMDSVKHASSLSFLRDKAYINGKWVSAKSGKTYDILNPSTGEVVGSVPDMGKEDIQEAIEVAYKTFDTWKNYTPRERSSILRKFYNLCMEHKRELAVLLTTEMGKPLADAEAEINYGSSFLEWFSEEARRIYGDVASSPFPHKRVLMIKQPVGVVGMITPWNFPNAMFTRKAGAALAAGCTIVHRPAEDTPLSTLALCELAEQAGVPPGVINVVTSDRDNAGPIGKEMCESPLVSMISFTGSTMVGKILLAQSASTVKKMSLELGGNAPFIVFDSADIDVAVAGLVACKFRCSGQTCVSANRILVQEGVYDKFVQALAKVMNKDLIVGDGLKEGVTQGPLINSRAVDKVAVLVDSAVNDGANVVTGGSKESTGGSFYPPTLLSNVSKSMKIAKEEIFGPVVAAQKFKTEQEALAIANGTSSGLAAYCFTTNMAQAWRVSEKLEFGLVGVNEGLFSAAETTFGGWKESGLGREGGRYGIEEYLEMKYITIGGIHPA